MPGLGKASGITPNRRTVVVLDKFTRTLQEPAFAFYRKADEIFRDQVARPEFFNFAWLDSEYIPGIGLRLKCFHSDPSGIYGELAFEGALADAQGRAAPHNHSILSNAKRAGIGITDVLFPLSPISMYVKWVASGASWNQGLTRNTNAPNHTAYDTAKNVELERIYETNANHRPDEDIHYLFTLPGSLQDRHGPLTKIGFSGPAGKGGTGRYQLCLSGDGAAILFEKEKSPPPPGEASEEWFVRTQFQFAPNPFGSMSVYLSIISNASEMDNGGWQGNAITFLCRQGSSYNELTTHPLPLGSTGSMQAATKQTAQAVTYQLPPGSEIAATQLGPLSIDARVDMRPMWRVAYSRFAESCTLDDDPFNLGFFPVFQTSLKLTYDAIVPTGCSINFRMFRADNDVELVGSTVGLKPNQKKFAVPDVGSGTICKHFYVRIEMTGPGHRTPTLLRYRVERAAVIQDEYDWDPIEIKDERGAPPSLPVTFVGEVKIEGETEDPSSSTAQITIVDMMGAHPEIARKPGTACRIEIWDDDDELVTVLHRGIIGRLSKRRITGKEFAGITGSTDPAYPNINGFRCEFQVQSEWSRAKRRLLPSRMVLWDEEKGNAEKVTDAIKKIARTVGYDYDQLDIPDLPIRLFGYQQGVIEPGTQAADVMQQLAEDFLGAHLVDDPNAGPVGMLRLLQRKKPPYRNLARFYIEHPGALKLPHVLGAYADGVGIDDQVIKAAYIVRGSESIEIEPAEANCVQVFGGGQEARGRVPTTFSAYAFNPVSFNPFGLASSSPHYPDRDSMDFLGEMVAVQVWDFSLPSQAAVNWICRRVFDQVCFAREFYTFIAPLILVTDEADVYQVRPRKLRFGDAVQIQQEDGSWRQYLVTRCSPAYTKDNMQMATYECITQTNIDIVGQPYSMFDLFSANRSRVRQLKRELGTPGRADTKRTVNRSLSVALGGSLAGWPAANSWAIQHMDPEADNFGNFIFMPDYDVPGTGEVA